MGTIDHVAVLGAGTMGGGIAQAAAQAGCTVHLRDVDATILEDARKRIETTLQEGIDRGKVTPTERDEALGNLHTTPSLEDAVSGADIVVEAVPEDLELKRSVFQDVETHAPRDAVLATNTSSLPITRIAEALAHPERVVGTHFFNPVHIMDLVEVVHGTATDDATLEAAVAWARDLGKDPIVVRDAPGFATSRLGVALGLEAIRMVEEDVASVEDIDKAMELGYRHPMGPLKLTDLVGLDVRLDIAEALAEELGPRFEPPELLREMVEAGTLGRKTGEGFYTYD